MAPPPGSNTKYYYDKGDFEEFMRSMNGINWKEEFSKVQNDPTLMYECFVKHLSALQDQYIPHKEVLANSRKNFVSLGHQDLRILRKKHRAWVRFLETRDGKKYLEYTKLRNKVRAITRKAKRLHEKNIADQAKSCPKKFWNYATAKSKTKERISALYKDDKKIELAQTDKEKAEVLSSFFSDVFTKEPPGPVPTLPPRLNTFLQDIYVTKENVVKKLKELNPGKSSGPDCVHPRILKELSEVACEPLTCIFNASLGGLQLWLWGANVLMSGVYQVAMETYLQ